MGTFDYITILPFVYTFWIENIGDVRISPASIRSFPFLTFSFKSTTKGKSSSKVLLA